MTLVLNASFKLSLKLAFTSTTWYPELEMARALCLKSTTVQLCVITITHKTRLNFCACVWRLHVSKTSAVNGNGAININIHYMVCLV